MGKAEAETVQVLWPSPIEWPLYVSIEKAAKIAGVSSDLMRKWADEVHSPIPHIVVGRRKKLIRVAAIPEYMQTKEW